MIIDIFVGGRSRKPSASERTLMTSALVVRDMTVSLRGRTLVAGVSFRIAQGERVALLGASGSGKSLTASAVLGQLPDGMTASGSMQVNGRETVLGRRGLDRTGDFAAVHQDPATALNPMVRLGRQLAFPLLNAGLSGAEARERAADLLRSVGLTDSERVLSGYSGELSGGQLQRVCIALALARRFTVLIADEPTTALDVISQAKVLDALRHCTGSTGAMLFITHDLAVAASLCTRALVMQSGRIIEEAPISQLLASPQHIYTRQLVEAAEAGTHAFAQEAGV
jgi:peptide/nickel transport system ATP-binding protein